MRIIQDVVKCESEVKQTLAHVQYKVNCYVLKLELRLHLGKDLRGVKGDI